jgi:formylglycine-generating enzyme required for sulfatase activity
LGPGVVLGSYKIVRKLGQGGMGVVFLAEHLRMGRRVALKVLPPVAMGNDNSLERFHREVRALATLSHPNIITAFDADEARGLHFFVMEYIEGEDLAALVRRRGALPVSQALHYLMQAASGLEYAHRKGLVHRDVKPSNMLVDGEGRVKLLDLGLARLTEHQEGTGRDLTGSGVFGTPEYMAPEQAERAKSADARSDIYSLGATLFHLLTGRSLFEGDSALERILAHLKQPIPSLREANGEVSEALDRVFRKMVAKKPDQRYQTMAELLKELRRLSRGATAGENHRVMPDKRRVGERRADIGGSDLAVVTDGAGGRVWGRRTFWLVWSVLGVSLVGWLVGVLLMGWLTGVDVTRMKLEPEPGLAVQARPETRQRVEQISDEVSRAAGERLVVQAAGIELPLRWCPAGSFTMGSPKSEPNRREDENQVSVTITKGFWMAETETTQELYERVMGTNPARFKGARLPVESVSWERATAFCKILTARERAPGRLSATSEYRLPREMEWEYACRAGTTTATAFGDSLSSEQANFDGNYPYNGGPIGPNLAHTCEVGKYPANAWGLRDMHGNVWEWCDSWYSVEVAGWSDPTWPPASSYLVFRGGSWFDTAGGCRSAYRSRMAPSHWDMNLGFRIVLSESKE